MGVAFSMVLLVFWATPLARLVPRPRPHDAQLTQLTQRLASDGASVAAAARGALGNLAALRLDGCSLVQRAAEAAAAAPCGVVRRQLPGEEASAWPPTVPALLRNSTGAWELGRARWSHARFMREFGEWRQPLSTFFRDPWLQLVGRRGEVVSHPDEISIAEYISIVEATRRNIFLFVRHSSAEAGAPAERQDQRRRFFDKLASGDIVPSGFTRELQIFAMDGVAVGHGMHRHAAAWLAQLAGRKVWWIAPPGAPMAGVELRNAAGRPNFPYKALSEEEGGWPCAWLLRQDLVPTGNVTVRRCVQHPGAVMVLPAGWWHMTCSLDAFNIAVGGQDAVAS